MITPKVEYDVISSTNLSTFKVLVNTALDSGWKLAQGFQKSGTFFLQPMTKETKGSF